MCCRHMRSFIDNEISMEFGIGMWRILFFFSSEAQLFWEAFCSQNLAKATKTSPVPVVQSYWTGPEESSLLDVQHPMQTFEPVYLYTWEHRDSFVYTLGFEEELWGSVGRLWRDEWWEGNEKTHHMMMTLTLIGDDEWRKDDDVDWKLTCSIERIWQRPGTGEAMGYRSSTFIRTHVIIGSGCFWFRVKVLWFLVVIGTLAKLSYTPRKICRSSGIVEAETGTIIFSKWIIYTIEYKNCKSTF